MLTLRLLRNVAFVTMLCAAFAGMQSRVLATMGDRLNEMCYPSTEHCSCHDNLTYGGEWSMSGSCDFSSEEDPISHGYEYCNAEFSACESECYSSDYREYVASWWGAYGDPWDPFREVQMRPECWYGFPVNNGCGSGEQVSWTCTCGAFNYCLP